MKTVLIVEDNVRNMELLVKIVKEIKMEVAIITASNCEEAEVMAFKNNVDLFMVDIILNPSNPGDVSGMKFAEHVRAFQKYKYTPIIFVTSLVDPELYAYSDIHCYYYVEKPFDATKVSNVIEEALEFPKSKVEEQSVFFRQEGVLYKKKISDIVYIENTRAGQTVYCINGNLELPYKSMKIILEELNSDRFLQCNRYTIVNRDYIDMIDMVNRYIELKGIQERIEIGNSFKKRFLREVIND